MQDQKAFFNLASLRLRGTVVSGAFYFFLHANYTHESAKDGKFYVKNKFYTKSKHY